MASERFVVLGLAHVRSSWFRDLARWANTAMVPVEFLKAMSSEEVRARLRAGRSYSALLVDDGVPGLDRDLIHQATEVGCAVIVVTGERASRSWTDVGATAVLAAGFDRGELLHVLGQVATPIARTDDASTTSGSEGAAAGFRGHLLAVTGPGGTGTSTVAAAIAQALGRDPRFAGLVCLADLALDADQGVLHGAPDVVPGVVELVEAHRSGIPSIDDMRRLTWTVPHRGYDLLLGLRRRRDWTAVRPRAFGAALDGLRRGYRAVVADVDRDLDGEAATGSIDIEDRNAMARTTVSAADLVVVVGAPGVKGLHSLLRCMRDVLALGVSGDRLLPLVNRSPRGPRARAEITAAVGELLDPGSVLGVPSPLHIGERRGLDEVVRDGGRLPDGWIAPLGRAVAALLERPPAAEPGAAGTGSPELVPVAPGSLGSWTDQDAS